MKQNKSYIIATLLAVTIALSLMHSRAHAQAEPSARFEYATIRWSGRDNSTIIRPGLKVEFLVAQIRQTPKPDREDDRAFYMNMAMNRLTSEGYRFVGMCSDEIVMERAR